MGGASAPLWVTVVLGVLAVVGTIGGAWGGQIIAARRDDKRWARDQEREDIRWQRERDRAHAQRQHEVTLHWREERSTVYSSALAVVDEWVGGYTAMLDRVAFEPLERFQFSSLDERVRVREIEARLWERLASTELVATKRVRLAASNLGQCCRNIEVATLLWSVVEPGEIPEKANTLKKKLSSTMAEARRQLVKEMRFELSVDPD